MDEFYAMSVEQNSHLFSYFDGKQFLVLELILILKEQLRQLSNLIKNI